MEVCFTESAPFYARVNEFLGVTITFAADTLKESRVPAFA
jgi:hypothetical protein